MSSRVTCDTYSRCYASKQLSTNPSTTTIVFSNFKTLATMKRRSLIAPMLLPNICIKGIPFVLLLGIALQLPAQDILYSRSLTDSKDSVLFTLKDLPELSPLNQDTILHPYYSFLWIFGDGNFVNGTRVRSIRHRYKPKPSTIDTFEVRAYGTNTYSSGDPPPMLINGDIFINEPRQDSTVIIPSSYVENGALYLQRNKEVRATDTLVTIISYKNSIEDNLSGQLYFFYNSPVKKKRLTDTEGTISTTVSKDFASFNFAESLLYFDNIDTSTYRIDSISSKLGTHFEKALVFNYNNLSKAEEQHLFLTFQNDSSLVDFLEPDATAEVEFMTLMTGFSDQKDVLSTEKTKQLKELGVFEFIDTLHQVNSYPTAIKSAFHIDNFKGNLANTIIDAFHMKATLVDAYHPNSISLDACQCPANVEQKKILFTIDCQNDTDTTSDVLLVNLDIPESIDFNSITDTLIRFSIGQNHNPDLKVNFTKDIKTRSIQWSIYDAQLASTAKAGYGNPATKAQIVFSALTRPETKLSEVAPIRACIQFGSNAKETFCTVPSHPKTIRNLSSGKDSICTECNCPTSYLWIWYIGIIGTIGFGFLLRYLMKGQPKEWVRQEPKVPYSQRA